MIRIILALIVGLIISSGAIAQDDESREGNFFGIGISYGVNFPAGEMSERFGTSFRAGVSLDWFKEKFNGSYGFESYILFGDNVKEDVVSSLRLENGAILGFDGNYADVFLRMRGNYSGFYLKKVLLPFKRNRRAGLALSLGLGALQHNVRIQVDSNNATHLEGEYQKGYDRNTWGPAFKQDISYTHVGKSRTVNYAISLSIIEGLTQNRRPINFDTGEKEEGTRLDMLVGLNFKWFIPLVDNREAEEIFY